MKISDDIRQLYLPVQPTVLPTEAQVVYLEILPDPKLQNYIYCYWQLKTTYLLTEPFYYRVVADGCIDIFFEVNNPQESFIMGFCKKYTEFQLENTFNFIGIRFLPTMFPQLFKVNASELSNRFEQLADVSPDTAKFLSESFEFFQTVEQIKTILDRYFLGHLQKITFTYDSRLYKALSIILQNSGSINVETDLDTGISSRQLRRLFEFYIGDTAKTFSQVVRFQHLLRGNPSARSLRENKLFFDAGYYDQAHFIKEFKNFYGLTPTKAFEK